jgi:hypothetical protein
MSKTINYKLEKLEFFSDFNNILYTNTKKLLKGYFYSRIIVYNKIDYKKLNVLNKCNFLFNMKLQTALMDQITVHFLLKKYYDKIFTSVLHESHKIHPSKGANISNILEMLNSSVHTQRGGGMRTDIIKFILLIGLFFSFFSPISSSSVPALPGNEDASRQNLPEAFTKARRQEEMNREKKKQGYGKYLGKGSAIVSGILTALLFPALKELTEEQIKELLDNIVLELNTETNNVYKLVSDHCDTFVTTLHENGILDSSSITEIVPEDFEKDKDKGAFVEKKANETSSSVYDYFFASSKPAESKPSIPQPEPNSTRKSEYDELVDDVIDEANEDDSVNVNKTGTALVFKGKNASKTASRFERYIEHAAEKFNDKDKLTIKYKFLCNSAFKSNIIIGQSDGMYLIRQLNGHISLVSENLTMMEQLKSFLLNMKSNAEKKMLASVLYLPNPIYKQIIQKIEIFELIMSNSLISYFPFSDMQTFNQSVSTIRSMNKKVSVESQWLNYENPMDKRTTQMKFNAEQEKQLFDANMRLQEAELRSEIETQQANQVIKENLERAQRIEETTNATQVYNKAKKREWGEFFDSNFGKDNILSQFVSTTINGGLFEGILGPLLENVKKYGYEILTFVLVGAGVVLFVYSVPSISFAISRRLKRETPAPAIQPAPATQGQGQVQAQPENVNTIVLARLPDENQVLQIKYDETGTPLEFDVIIINQHMRGDITNKLFNLLNYYKQDRTKIILFTLDDNILCGKFISIKSNKILIETVNGIRTVDYDDIIDPIITPYLNTEHIREKYIQCLSMFTAKQPSLPLSMEEISELNSRLLQQPSHRHTRRSQSSRHRRSRRRSRSSSSESSESSRSHRLSHRSSRRRSSRSRSPSPSRSSRELPINEPHFVNV